MSENPKHKKAPDFREKDKQDNHRRINDFIMRGGGEPFGKPFEIGTPTLTERVVTFFKQHSFFGFETFEKPKTQKKHNKFTKYGAARYRGTLKAPHDEK